MSEKRITEKQIFRYFGLFLVFLLLSFNRDMALVYIGMMVMDYIWWDTDKKVSLPTEKVNKRAKSLVYAIGGYLVFFAANLGVRSVFGVETGLQTVLTELSSTTPILQGSNFLTLLSWGIIIPIIETRFFFGRILEGVSETFGINLTSLKFNGRIAFVSIIISALFALFHITSKNLENVPLIMTFIFALISCYLVIKEKQTLGAILFHMFVNTSAVLYTFRPEIFSALPFF